MRCPKVLARLLTLLLFSVIIGSSACKREAIVIAVEVCLSCEHHGVPNPDMTVYHKGGGDDHPGFRQNMLSVYDSLRQTGLRHRTCFGQLGPGTHHFAAEGYDPLIRDSVIGTLQLVVDTRTPLTQELVMEISERH